MTVPESGHVQSRRMPSCPPRSDSIVGLPLAVQGSPGWSMDAAAGALLHSTNDRAPVAVLEWLPEVTGAYRSPERGRYYRIKVGDDERDISHEDLRTGAVWDYFPGALGTGTRPIRDVLANVVAQLAQIRGAQPVYDRTGWHREGARLVYVTGYGCDLLTGEPLTVVGLDESLEQASEPPPGPPIGDDKAREILARDLPTAPPLVLLSLGCNVRAFGSSFARPKTSAVFLGGPGAGKTTLCSYGRMVAFELAREDPAVMATFQGTDTIAELTFDAWADLTSLFDDMALQIDDPPAKVDAYIKTLDKFLRSAANGGKVRARSNRKLGQGVSGVIRGFVMMTTEQLPQRLAASILRRCIVFTVPDREHKGSPLPWMHEHKAEHWRPFRWLGERVVRDLGGRGWDGATEYLTEFDQSWRRRLSTELGDIEHGDYAAERSAQILAGLDMAERAIGLVSGALTAQALPELRSQLRTHAQRIGDRLDAVANVPAELGRIVREALLTRRAHVVADDGGLPDTAALGTYGQALGLRTVTSRQGDRESQGEGVRLWWLDEPAKGLAVKSSDLLALIPPRHAIFGGLSLPTFADRVGPSGALVLSGQRGRAYSWQLRLPKGSGENGRYLVLPRAVVFPDDAGTNPSLTDPPLIDPPGSPSPYPSDEVDCAAPSDDDGAGNPAGWLSALSPADADRYAPSDDADDAERDAESRLLARIASLPLADVARGVLLVGRELDEATRELDEATEALALYRGLTASDHWHMASAMAGLEHRGAESEAAPAPVVDEAAAMVRDAFELDADPRPRAAALGELVTRSPSPSLPDGPEPPATGASGAVGADGPRAPATAATAPATPATVAVASPDALPAPSPRRARSERHSEARGALTWRSWQYAPRRRCAVDLVAHTWRADDGAGGRIAGRHKVATLGETLAAIGAAVGGQAATIYLVGSRPGGSDPRAVRAWFRSPVPGGWAHDAKQGHYLVDLDRPVGHYRSPGGGRVAVHRFAAWAGDDLASCSPAVALDALATIDRALRSVAGRGVRWDEATALATPPTTGIELVRAAVPFDKATRRSRVYPPIDTELRDLIRHTSGQGRVELCAAPGATLPGLVALDGRFMYAALTGGLPIGSAALVGPRDFDPRLPARWRLRATVPADWRHVGVLPAERETPDEPERWPAVPGETFTTWADSAEAKVAHDRGWPLVVLGAIVFAAPGDPLGNASGRKRDGWAGHLVAARELVGRWRSSGELDADLAAIASAGLRSVLLFALGAMVGRARVVSHVGTAEQVPTGAAPEPLGGGLFTWETDEPITAERGDLDRPEWSAHVYGRTRARLLVGSPSQPGGALSVPRANVVGFVMDALYLTADPHWHDDGASPGWFRAKGTSAGPVTVPATAAELHTLAGGEP